MTVKYVFEIESISPYVDVPAMINRFAGTELPKTDLRNTKELKVTHVAAIPNVYAHEFEELLKRIAYLEYQITAVTDVPVDENGYVIDSWHPDFRKEEWINVE